MRVRVLAQVARTTFREFWRTPEAVFWTYGFPLVLAIVLSMAFGGEGVEPVRVVVEAGEAGEAIAAALDGDPRVRVGSLPAAEAERELRLGNADLWVSAADGGPVFHFDPTRPGGELARLVVEDRLQRDAGRRDPLEVAVDRIVRPGSRYIDFLIPGLIALNLLGAGMYGVGFNLVQMRVRQLLRRLLVTPMTRAEFLLAFLAGRMVLVVPESLVILGFGVWFFGVPVNGGVLAVLLLVMLGGVAFSGLGLLVASRVRTIEGVSGLMNLVMLPMWLLGGTFFSSERFPDVMQPLIRALPLTHLNDALRGTMLEGRGLADEWVAVAFLLAFAAVCFAAALRLFRWT